MIRTIASVLLVAGWLPMLVGIGKRRRRGTPAVARDVVVPADRVLLGVTWVLCIALTLVAVFDAQRQHATWRLVVGVALFVLGMAAWLWGRAAHGNEFAQLPRVPPALVRSGPYRFVRHPLYLATAIGTFGHVLSAGTLRVAALWLALAVVFAVRARREEQVLRGAFGPGLGTPRPHTRLPGPRP